MLTDSAAPVVSGLWQQNEKLQAKADKFTESWRRKGWGRVRLEIFGLQNKPTLRSQGTAV